jgi:hypothetical protein
VDDLGKLVYTLTCVIRLGINIFGTKVSPLEAIHRAEIADLTMIEAEVVEKFARSIAIPDLDASFTEAVRGSVAFDEPQELGNDCSGEDTLCSKERKNGNSVLVQ